jgi:PAS domain S-box-containing protein
MSLPVAETDAVSGAEFAARALFEHAQELFLLTDDEARIVEVNPAWTRILGWEREALIGRSILDFLQADHIEDLRQAHAEVQASGYAQRTFQLKASGGDWRWFEGSSRRAAPGLMAAVLRDVNSERELAIERARTAAKTALLTERVGVTSWTLDSATRTFTRSRPMPDFLGQGETLTFSVDDMRHAFHPDDYAHASAMIELAMTEGRDGTYEARLKPKDGVGWFHFRIDYHCERLDGRWIVHGLSRDITEMVVARDAATAAAQEAQGVLENAPFASCILGRNLEYISVSGAWRAMFDAYDEPFVGREFASKVSSAMRRRLHKALKRALAGEVYTREEEEVARPTGAVIFRWQARPWRAANGDVRGVIIYATDITETVRRRREIEQRKKRLKLALEAANAAVFEVDYVNKTFWSGPGFTKLTGRALTFEDVVGVWPTVHPEDFASVEQQIANFDSQNPAPIECRMLNDGRRWTRSHIRVQHDTLGRPRKSIGLIQDIDAQKRQEIALEKAERQASMAADAKSNFLANISHEIRTPMNGVLGVLQLIKREHLDAEERRLLDEALASGRMLTEMLDDLLDFSNIETGQFELHPEALDPTAVLVGVSSLLEPAASAKGLKMTAVAAPDLGMVKADPLRLRQALYNLMGNAVKFTPQGSIEARLARHTAADGSQRLRFEVQDTGIGVPEDFQATLFERFEQADGSATRKYGGSGLGLAITKRLAEMMGGAVGFSSTPGQGSTFWIEIDGAAVEPAEAVQADEPDIGEFRVLLVEDNATNRLVISKILEALGVQVDTAEDGAEGVERAATGHYDLVLMDIQMPGMDGIEATKRIRAMDGAVASTPIVAVTANVLADQRSSYADAGMDGVVSKPVSAASLIAEIARVTERSAAA